MRAATFGQCIDAIRAMHVDWNPGSVEGESDQTILARLKRAELPLVVPDVPILAHSVEERFDLHLPEQRGARALLRDRRRPARPRQIWAGLKSPILAQQNVAKAIGLPQEQVTVNVITGGGSFGHKLFCDPAIEAAKISKAMGVPVKLMWHRADDPRQGRCTRWSPPGSGPRSSPARCSASSSATPAS